MILTLFMSFYDGLCAISEHIRAFRRFQAETLARYPGHSASE
jgi:hypothetical protein